MTYNETVERLRENLREYFTPLGFAIFKTRSGAFVLKKDMGDHEQLLTMGLSDHTYSFNPSFRLSIFYKPVNDLIIKSCKEYKDMILESTLSFNKSFKRQEEDDDSCFKFYRLNSVETIDEYSKNCIACYEKHKIFFEQTNTLDKVDKLLNSYPLDDDKYIYTLWQKAEIGIIVAKLVNNPTIITLANEYHKLLVAQENEVVYEKILDYLEIPYQPSQKKEIIIEPFDNQFINTENMTQTISINGFDSDGEPEITVQEDGSIELVFSFMPPLNGKEEQGNSEYWDTFEDVLSKELAIEVIRDDREVFLIQNPNNDTINKLTNFLENYWLNI